MHIDPDSEVPLLSVPPNVNFPEGLTVDTVVEGAPLWAGQERRQRAVAAARAKAALPVGDDDGVDGDDGAQASVGGGKEEEREKEELPPAPSVGGLLKSNLNTSRPQRMQVAWMGLWGVLFMEFARTHVVTGGR